MEVNIRQLDGPWDAGYALDKHTLSSVCVGHNEYGHPVFETTRSEAGEALFNLKYRSDWSQVDPLAQQLVSSVLPLFDKVHLLLPMPASTTRLRQPVDELCAALSKHSGIPVFDNVLVVNEGYQPTAKLKDLRSKEEKQEVLKGKLAANDGIEKGCWNALIVDDLYHSGATMEAATKALRGYSKINRVYVAVCTWR
ncbi:ComF family protein [Roseovarius sp. A21]|uniref:ComF family protein n=1 Tax=Roseovarius bejariae TaxID=2576383 RepID=A0A844CUV0_9RHOB|nr:ComF family protein [Roseovarius bejariae]MRU15819.1 ComF family protein [Roseovarius bejariae]